MFAADSNPCDDAFMFTGCFDRRNSLANDSKLGFVPLARKVGLSGRRFDKVKTAREEPENQNAGIPSIRQTASSYFVNTASVQKRASAYSRNTPPCFGVLREY